MARYLFALLALVLLSVCQSGVASVTYSGELVWDSNETQLIASDGWADPNTKIEWSVEQVSAVTWQYTYTLTVPRKDVSHIIIEVSDNDPIIWDANSNLEIGDGNGFELGTHNATGSSGGNPHMPEDMFGVKFEVLDGDENATIFRVSYKIDRDPVWGDFYAKDGFDDGNAVMVFNAGFTANDWDPDPNIFGPDSTAVTDHILVPDTIPEPAAVTLICLGGAALLLRRKRR